MMRLPTKREEELYKIFRPWMKIDVEIGSYIDEKAPDEAKRAFKEFGEIGKKYQLFE